MRPAGLLLPGPKQLLHLRRAASLLGGRAPGRCRAPTGCLGELTLATAAAAAAGSAASAPTAADAAGGSGGLGARLPPLLARPGMSQPQQAQQPQLSLEETLQAVAVPPAARQLGPRVEHIEVTADGQLSDVIASALQLPRWFVLELIRFGAVHFSPIMPRAAERARPLMSEQHLARLAELRAAGVARHGRNPKLQHPQRVLEDRDVCQGGYVRVHVHPKRFPAAHSVDWRSRVLANAPEYVVVDKPPGIQVPPTVDNLLESVVSCAAAALGLPRDSLLNPHRLDAGTSGVVLLAKNSSFAAWFSGLLRSKPGSLVKLYRCITAAPPPAGRLVHYAAVATRQPGEPAHTRMWRPRGEDEQGGGEGEQGARCELVVQQVERVGLTGAAAEQWGPEAYESTIQLVTGRTHQIRAQMAAEGCPLLGDLLYQALAGQWQLERQQQELQEQQPRADGAPLAQQPGPTEQQQQQGQQQQGQQQQGQPANGSVDWESVFKEDPLRPIGLQAFALQVHDPDGRMCGGGGAGDGGEGRVCEFQTGTPWWRA